MAIGLAFTQAIYVLIFVADKTARGDLDLVPTSAISETVNIPRPSAVKILQLLGLAGIIESATGVKGGVRLLRSPDRIRLDEVYHAIEGKKALFRTDHKLNATGTRPDGAKAEVERLLAQIELDMITSMQKVTLASLLDRIDQTPPPYGSPPQS